MTVRQLLHSKDSSYNLNRRNLPARSGLVFGLRHKVVFSHGCGLHGHKCRIDRISVSRLGFWSCQVNKNNARDPGNIRDLANQCRKVCVVSESETVDLDSLGQRLVQTLDGGAT